MILLTRDIIDTAPLLAAVNHEDCGAAVLFVGTTRRRTHKHKEVKTTVSLHYDAYAAMAESELAKLVEQVKQQWPIHACAVAHRLGEVPVAEASIALAVSSPHRVAAFEACAWLMDQIKTLVPIWKREHFADGSEEWVHPGSSSGS